MCEISQKVSVLHSCAVTPRRVMEDDLLQGYSTGGPRPINQLGSARGPPTHKYEISRSIAAKLYVRHFATFYDTWRHFAALPLFTAGQGARLLMSTWRSQRRKDVRLTAKLEDLITTGPISMHSPMQMHPLAPPCPFRRSVILK